ncbi:sugar MFS transporter [Flavihumibacter fluvii]|uniref:sugar MFS transporter n=1 Tax=Flavihumibacter fluvii TaxID=2838157 RepID=UPI001BDEF9C2|nr:sugar MFS transporter [Flavihumibacter fluvii]ULQ50862.1 sugar MFS transporter [Flavihumibacter fluvii]
MKLKQPIYIIGLLFFVFGFVTWLGSVLIPYLRIACEISSFESYFVAFSFYISYTLMAIPASRVLKQTGFKKGMSLGLFIMAIGAVIFIPAALGRQYGLFLLGLFAQGAGLTLLQTAANPYITILGPKESAAKRISIMGICNGIAGMLAPAILGAVILQNADGLSARIAGMTAAGKINALQELASRVILPYSIMAIVLVLLALLIQFSGLPDVDEDPDEEAITVTHNRKTSIWQFPHLLLGVSTLFLYVGVEVIAVDSITGYAEYQGLPLSKAKFFASFTLLNMLLGYIIGITCIPRFIQQENALKWSAAAGLIFGTAALLTSGTLSVSFIALLGLANALIWPSIWPLAIAGLGRFTKTGASLLVMAIGGGAVLPLLYGYLADQFSAHSAYAIVLPAYLGILLYAAYGHKIRTL